MTAEDMRVDPATTTADEGWHRVVEYQWPQITPPPLDASWEPTRSVSVVVPAYQRQDLLDRTLAALAHQRYPSSLLEVVIADDGSSPPMVIGERAPEHTRVVLLDREKGSGPARARDAGAQHAEGEILLFLDADMVVFPDHVRAHARWHHVIREAVTLGHKLFVNFDGISADDVADAARDDRLFELLDGRPTQTHEWIEALTQRLANLTQYKAEMFTAAVTATIGMRADLYREAGGFHPHLKSGEDMEFGYRLMTAGAVFIPEPQAKSWHQGEATFMSKALEVRRRNDPNFANYVPIPGRFRPWTPGRQYAVPMVGVVVAATADSFESTKRCIDAALASEEPDLHVVVCCSEDSPDFELVRHTYRDDPRVKFAGEAVDTAFPARFTLFLPEWAGLGPGALTRLLSLMEDEHLGVIQVVIPGVPPADGMLRLWRTAALHRARRTSAADGDIVAVAGRLFGERWVHGSEIGVTDLRTAEDEPSSGHRPTLEATLAKLERTKLKLREARDESRTLRRELKQLQKKHDRLERDHRRLRNSRVVRLARLLGRLRPRFRR